MSYILSTKDIEKVKHQGATLADVEKQLSRFELGFPFLEVANFASVGKGISLFEAKQAEEFISLWDKYLTEKHDVVKFVPASGAASRMFKDLFEFLKNDSNALDGKFLNEFFTNIRKFAFFEDLNSSCLTKFGLDVENMISKQQYKEIVSTLLLEDGLNYGGLPKGLLKFHSYPVGSRTPLEEHLVEGALYAKTEGDNVVVHFTVSPEHRSLFEKLVDKVKGEYEKDLQVIYNISFSEQKKKTDTIAVDEFNNPFRNDGDIFFRPGGHGALIENLNDINADIVFLKNIDNVVPDNLKTDEAYYKKCLAGYLVVLQSRIFRYLELIDSGVYSREELLDILYFLQEELNIRNSEMKYMEDAELVLYLQKKLNRPIRVCGMVQNVGEAGGGPFFTVNPDGSISLQILESTQIDLNNIQTKDLFVKGTHFNPVDIVCGVKNYKGESFNLLSFVDENTGFISEKSKDGKALKALELPGLWNGAMSDWNTVFVEVPLITFNPVKSVNDLLRKEHQS